MTALCAHCQAPFESKPRSAGVRTRFCSSRCWGAERAKLGIKPDMTRARIAAVEARRTRIFADFVSQFGALTVRELQILEAAHRAGYDKGYNASRKRQIVSAEHNVEVHP